MKQKLVLFLALAAVMLLPVGGRAQQVATPPPAPMAAPMPAPDLSSLPDADLLVLINPAKIVNEAMPKLVPAKQLDDLQQSLEGTKKAMSVDIRQMNYIAVAIRMRKPAGSDPVPLPEVLVAVKGGLSAGTLLNLLKLAGPDVHTEKYGTHDLYTYTVKDIAKQSETIPLIGSYAELGLAVLHDDLYVAGTTGFVKAAIDADEGRGRLKPQLAQSITRDPESLIAIGGSMLTGMARAIALIDPSRPGTWDCLNSFGQGYAAVRQTETGLRVTGALNGDNPETAGILKNMIVFLIKQAQNFAPDPEFKTVLAALNISVEGNEIIGSGDISQETIKSWLEKKPKPEVSAPPETPATPQAATPAATKTKPSTASKRRRRTTH